MQPIALSILLPALLAGAAARGQVAAPRADQEPRTGEPATASASSSSRGEVERLIAELAKAHRVGAAPQPITAFTGQIRLQPQKKGESRIAVITDVRFQLEPVRIRYQVEEEGRRLERGRDRWGPWARFGRDEEPVNLNRKEYEGDREQLRREIRLARQLVRLLDPAELVRTLGPDATVARENLPGARKPIPCETVAGTIDFPLYLTAAEQQRSRVKLWINPETHLLVACEASPIDPTTGKPAPYGEFIHMLEHRPCDGIVLPTSLFFYRIEQAGAEVKLTAEAEVILQSLVLRPELKDGAFDRDHSW